MNHKLADKLTILFMHYLQADFNQQEVLVLDRYRKDPVFHAKVNYLTALVLQIVEECDK